MPGNGTFNLTALWRALGIKNPQPTISERVQLVVQVADLSKLAPLHRPAAASFGGVVPAGAGGTSSVVEITSTSPGGTLISRWGAGKDVELFQRVADPALAAAVVQTPNATWSRDPIVSRVRTGTTLLASPANSGEIDAAPLLDLADVCWLPPAVTAVFASLQPATQLNGWFLFLIDLPAVDAPPD